MTVGGRILITSKRPTETLTLRKPIKGCYCNHEPKKIQHRSARTISKPHWPCNYCKSNFDVCVPTPVDYNSQETYSPLLSCKTLQKVQRINYTPRSEFLRRVQKKVSEHYNICGTNRSEPAISSSRLNEDVCGNDNDILKQLRDNKFPKHLRIADSNSDITRASNGCPCVSQIGLSDSHSKVSRSKLKGQDLIFDNEKTCVRASKTQTNDSKISKSKISPRKTISSEKYSDSPPITKVPSKSSSKSKKSYVLSQKKSCCTDCCPVNERIRSSSDTRKKFDQNKCAKCCCLSRLCTAVVSSHDDYIDHEAVELQKFREKNYFDTHGSRQTLLSSSQSSSGSLEQFQLNERLFPESIGKIHRNNIVVSMPICTTKQLKRIHYFPRHIVKQQINSVPPVCHSKKGRHKSCPLTGHAIDLGTLKTPRPTNSLALKFQK